MLEQRSKERFNFEHYTNTLKLIEQVLYAYEMRTIVLERVLGLYTYAYYKVYSGFSLGKYYVNAYARNFRVVLCLIIFSKCFIEKIVLNYSVNGRRETRPCVRLAVDYIMV